MDIRWNNLGKLAETGSAGALDAIVDLGDGTKAPQTYSHDKIDRLANGVAQVLTKADIPPGSAIAIASLNRAEFLIAYFGIMRAGFIAVPVNIKQPQAIVDYVIGDADVRLAFVDAARRDQFAARVPVIDFDDAGPSGFRSLVTETAFEHVPAETDDIAQMLYTSGSTGRPKGVPLSHAGQLWALAATSRPKRGDDASKSSAQERYLLAQPLFHMNGLFMAKRAFSTNSVVVILPAFDTARYVEALTTYRISVLTAVPTMFARIVRDTALHAGKDFSSLKRVMLGSAPMTAGLLERIQSAFPHAEISHGYGTTEAGPAVFGPHPDGLPTPPLALGYPLHPEQVALVGGVHENEGILQMRNPAVMQGYHRLPEKNAIVLKDGWYDSGDVMRRDAEGFYYFIGRADDMFVCGGENIYPGDVERVLESHPEVRQACVVPLNDEERHAVPVAFVVREPRSRLDLASLQAYSRQHGAVYQYPRRVAFVHDLPWAGTNKVDRRALSTAAESLELTQGWSQSDHLVSGAW